MSLKELRRKRLNWVEANRENRFDKGIERLLTNLYPDNAHFIYELLQNAEDAQATEVRFILREDGVEFEHNGKRLFTLEDVDSITSIGFSTKKDDQTSIGKFGVGFKAVFAYTATPEIASGQFHFRIRDLVVPDTDDLSPCTLSNQETRFSLPFDNPQKPPEIACREIEKNLRQLDESTLLFLSNIRKIEYLLPDSALGFLERKETDGSRIEILVKHPEDSEPVSVFFLRFEKTVDVTDEDGRPKSCRIAVAFGLEKGQAQAWKIKPLQPGRVHIYFPAEKETSNLQFHLHAPFASTVARDSVRDCSANDELRDHLATLIAQSMTAIRNQELLTVGFLATLPNKNDNLSPFYKPILERLIEVFRNEKLVPMKQGGYAAAKGIFRGLARLSDLIRDSDLATLLGEDYSPPLWIDNPPQINQREDNFLAMLGIREWTIEDLVERLSEDESSDDTIKEWLTKKPEAWHQRLYSLLNNFLSNAEETRKSTLSKLRIVRCIDNIYRVGHECYFPDEDREHDESMPRVAKGVYASGKNEREQENAHKFLKAIGVREVGEAERIETILKQRYSTGSIRLRKQDMKRFIALVEKDLGRAELFSNYYIFELEDGKGGKPADVFLDTPYCDTGLKAYHDALGENWGRRKWVLSPNYQKSDIKPERLRKFAEAVGAQTRLEPRKQEIPFNHPEREALLDNGGWSRRRGINKDYDILEFGKLVADPSLDKSKLIWRTMNELPDACLQATYCSNSRYWENTANSSLVHRLRNKKWVPQKTDGQEKVRFSTPSEAVSGLLPGGFLYKPESKWLEAIEFAKAEREREEAERRKKEQASQEYQRKNDAAKEVGFSSSEEADEAKETLALKREDPEGFRRWQEEANRQKPAFPEKASHNPERRGERLAEQHANAPDKEYQTRKRSVRTSRGNIDPKISLRAQYTNEDAQMICQICKEEMPFKKRDGEYYFEAVEALSSDYLPKEHEPQFLALCPLCAAMYKEFVKDDDEAMQELYRALKDSDDLKVPLKLGERETSIRFVETHFQDIRTILHQNEKDIH